MFILKRVNKIYKFCVLQVIRFKKKFVGTVFVSSSFALASASVISLLNCQ